jgi:hypothetical protein
LNERVNPCSPILKSNAGFDLTTEYGNSTWRSLSSYLIIDARGSASWQAKFLENYLENDSMCLPPLLARKTRFRRMASARGWRSSLPVVMVAVVALQFGSLSCAFPFSAASLLELETSGDSAPGPSEEEPEPTTDPMDSRGLRLCQRIGGDPHGRQAFSPSIKFRKSRGSNSRDAQEIHRVTRRCLGSALALPLRC